MIMVSALVTGVLLWIDYLVVTKSDRNRERLTTTIISTVYSVLLLLGGFWMLSSIHSLEMVINAGGTGWERQNYKDIRMKGRTNVVDSSV